MTRLTFIRAAAIGLLLLSAPAYAQSSGGSSGGGSSGGSAGSSGAGSVGGGTGAVGGAAGGIGGPAGGVGGAGAGSPLAVPPGGGQTALPGTNQGPAQGTTGAMAPGSAATAPSATGTVAPALPSSPQSLGTLQPSSPTAPGEASTGNPSVQPGGGVSGPQTTRSNPDAQCDVVLAHPSDFTGPTVEACSQRKGQAAPGRTAAGGNESGIRATDRPSEVQKSLEPSDRRAVDSICKGC